ncbi:rhamnan synthesis F family protein [Luteimonas sp. 3794]|uniref:rhamnan synthesis F family protein n=1 Tax=Luteimonas sp. 3794 TaxID=2817730 RepID=UPI00285BE727|nr:rhamnan synthesis F family protein [Luteimonas sp. 3794]MDR6991877.1 FMN phosphatase YigB (HAD superfamily) [Luteimonas sp. 3794]
MSHISAFLRALRRSIEVRGGGLRGIAGVIERTWKMLRALGPGGVLARIQSAGRTMPPALMPADHYPFPPPFASDRNMLRVGVVVHMFYPDLADEFAVALSRMPLPFVLLVSVTDPKAEATVRAAFASIEGAQRLEIVRVPNRGRDIAPLLVTFREQILQLDVVGHLHTKKSLYTGSTQDRWRTYLVDALMGSRERIEWQLGMFAAEPKLGLIYPESHETVPLSGHTWLANVAAARTISVRLGVTIDPDAYLDFPAGSMFWARVEAIRPMLALRLPIEAFPEEQGQLDGTLQHAVERLFVATVRAGGFLSGVLPRDGALALTLEGARNWHTYFASPLEERIGAATIDSAFISLDIFDTLVQRPFITPEGARHYLARLAEVTLGVTDFVNLRARAEALARHKAGRDPTLGEIYAAVEVLEAKAPADDLQALELETERRLLQPRTGVLAALAPLRRRKLRMVVLSDMYLSAATLREVLPPAVSQSIEAWYVSCETGCRKYDGDAWPMLVERERQPLSRCVHIGDHERADLQQPRSHGMEMPVHVLRASALLEVVPALRPLRIAQGASWCEQLRLGLIANHFSHIADVSPNVFRQGLPITPDTFGYVVLGPFVLDFVTWLAQLARAQGVEHLLFLSREGHLLSQAFERVIAGTSSTRPDIRGSYFLASRQATGLAAIRSADDIDRLFEGTFNGTLGDLLDARLGETATRTVSAAVGAAAMYEPVFLPEMHAVVLVRLTPAVDALLELAASTRETYQEYWREKVGTARPMVVDIGYAGTIQRNLAGLLGHSVDGAYCALDGRARSRLEHVGQAHARYHDGRNSMAPSTVLSHDLLLESVLTASHAQFAGFQPETRTPLYARQEIDATQWATIDSVHKAALRFIDAALSMAGPLSQELVFNPESVQVPLECVGSGRWAAPWLRRVGVDDAFTGRGHIAAAPLPKGA